MKNQENKNNVLEKFEDFEKVKPFICFVLVNRERNRELLKRAPHRSFVDMEVVYQVVFSWSSEQITSCIVTNAIMNVWKIDEQTLFEHAFVNTKTIFQPCISRLDRMLEELAGEPVTMQCANEETLYIATNSIGLNGAAVILYDQVLQFFANKIHDDFYILPSSTHEVLFLPAGTGMEEEDILRMVREINEEHVEKEYVLSDNIYYYNMDTGLIDTISG